MAIVESTKSAGWFMDIVHANQPSSKSLASKSNPTARSATCADAILEAACSGPDALACLSKALSTLSEAGIAEPSDKTSSGIELGAAFAAAHWLPGLQWARDRLAPAERVELAQIALWTAACGNNPAQAIWALQDWNPGAEKLSAICAQAPETAVALAERFSGAERSALVDAAMSCLASPAPSTAWQRAPELPLERVLAVRASVERLKLMEATAETPASPRSRAYPGRNL